MAEKAKQGKEKVVGGDSSAVDTSDTTSKGKMQRPRTLSNEDVDKMAPEQMFRTSLNEHGEMIQDEEAPAETTKTGKKNEDDLDLYDAMTAE